MSARMECTGTFTELDGRIFYKIADYDKMEDFFMTITSSSDIWNFCWAQGGITAGRIDCDHAIFPYYTADKVSDARTCTGAYTAIKSGGTIWEPFIPLPYSTVSRIWQGGKIHRNIYKNTSGTEVWFEEVNEEAQLSFRYGWTSSDRYGLVRKSVITNLSDKSVRIQVLDGCRNILPACVDADFQNNNSVLLDAYKKTDMDRETKLALFAVSSIVTDKAEPSEGLFANSCWFSTDDPLVIDPNAPHKFAMGEPAGELDVVKGRRPAAYIIKDVTLGPRSGADASASSWYQVFDVRLDYPRIAALREELSDRASITASLEADIQATAELMDRYLADADGIQKTAETMTCAHHEENVMFNIMRGGIPADQGKIDKEDFVLFVMQRNKAEAENARRTAGSVSVTAGYSGFEQAVKDTGNPQLMRLFYEYMPLTFSRRHGDPSRPWNRFKIRLHDHDGKAILNYEGNWRDIFQNWEALVWSYPMYIKSMCAKFLNAMTAEGFNPYRISREGIDWETPDPDNPWAQIGYWGDHQVIYLQKLLEFYSKTNRRELVASLSEKRYASANVPYRIKAYKDIVLNPRDTIIFDRELSERLQKESISYGSDAKLIRDGEGKVVLVSLASKLLQIVIAKMGNFIPGGGIWMNTQRPEWNDANNALAGYGLSVVTLNYLYRYLLFLEGIFAESGEQSFSLPTMLADSLCSLGRLFSEINAEEASCDGRKRRAFADKAGAILEAERSYLYEKGISPEEKAVAKSDILAYLGDMRRHAELAIRRNKRDDGLFHSYNTMRITEDSMELDNLQEMLEGQVAALSSTLLSPEEARSVIVALKKSRMYEPRQNSYMLYPDKELPSFLAKNVVTFISQDERSLAAAIRAKTGDSILCSDKRGNFHFNGEFRNAGYLRAAISALPDNKKLDKQESSFALNLYERTFNHQAFTGRSGTFYAYEGLGSIYWHMVSKLLLAVQENALRCTDDKENFTALAEAYYDIRGGLSFNKSPALYGAFPSDPYSHTPRHQGAKQPGMTGQVKEEILTRWGELGLDIRDGTASFRPRLLHRSEFFADGTLSFSWCGTQITYRIADKDGIMVDGKKTESDELSRDDSARLFERDGSIKEITVNVASSSLL